MVGESTLSVMDTAEWYKEHILSEFGKYAKKGKVLEIGSGIGVFTKKLTRWGDVVGTEIDKSYLPRLSKLNSKRIRTGFGDIESNKLFVKEKFDIVVCFNVLEHIKDDEKALRNICGNLKKGGRLFLLVPAHMVLMSTFDKLLGHYRRYSKSELQEKLQRAGFSVIENKHFNWWGAVGWFLYLKVFGKKELPSAGVGIFDKLGRLFLWPEKVIAPPFGLSVFVVAEK